MDLNDPTVQEAIAKAVAKAVAAHDDQTSWFDELWHNAEVMVTLGIAGLTVFWAGVKWVGRKTDEITAQFHSLDKRVQSVEEYREAHDKADDAAHGRLEAGNDEVLRELREFRGEAKRQHEAIQGEVKEIAKEGREGRGKIYEKLDPAIAQIERLVGYHEART